MPASVDGPDHTAEINTLRSELAKMKQELTETREQSLDTQAALEELCRRLGHPYPGRPRFGAP